MDIISSKEIEFLLFYSVFLMILLIKILLWFKERSVKKIVSKEKYLGRINQDSMWAFLDYAKKKHAHGLLLIDTEDEKKWMKIEFQGKKRHKVKLPSWIDRYYIDESRAGIEKEIDEKDETYTLIMETDSGIYGDLYTVFCESSLKMGKLCQVTYLFDAPKAN